MSMLIPIRDLNPTRRFPVVTVTIIGLNVLMFFVTDGWALSNRSAFQYGAVPCDVMSSCPPISDQLSAEFASRSPWLSVLTSMFTHSGILHLAFNMLFLWTFGNNVEDRLGRIRFPLFYLAAGLGASFAHILYANGQGGEAGLTPIVGASGAISPVLGAYIVLWPRATVVSLVPIFLFFFSVRTPAWVALGLWFVVQLIGGANGLGQVGGGVAYLAHIGGFVAGAVLIFVFGGFARRDGPVIERAGTFDP